MGTGGSHFEHAVAIAERLLIAPERGQRTPNRHSAFRRDGDELTQTEVR
jgi:hypothetical protein